MEGIKTAFARHADYIHRHKGLQRSCAACKLAQPDTLLLAQQTREEETEAFAGSMGTAAPSGSFWWCIGRS